MRGRAFHALSAALLLTPAAQAQMPGGPSPVRYTEVLDQDVRRSVELPGSVESRTESMVAGEVAGVVARINAREGETLRKGAPLVQLKTTNLDLRLRAATGQLKEARARLELSDSNLDRSRDLRESGVISQEEYDDAFSEFTAWEGRIDALTAEIDRIKTDLERCTIRAPFTGVLVSERVDIGEWVDVGDPVAEMVALDIMEVRVEVPERYFPTLTAGTTATVTFESMPGVQVDGTVTAIIPRADTQARTFPVKVTIPNDEGRIGVGMLAHVALPLGESYRATLVPKDAVVAQGPMRVVYRINGDDTVETVQVDVGRGVNSWVIVAGALQSGERVVTRGNERLMPGQPVKGTVLEYPRP